MKDYNIISPSLDSILSDDHLYFEGINRPSDLYILRDKEDITEKEIDILDRYFNDIYNLFLRKISSFTIFDYANNEDTIKLQALLQELIKVRELILKWVKSNQKI